MPRKMNKSDRLAKIKQAMEYPSAAQAIARRLTAKDSQSVKRPLGDVPVAQAEPKHLSGAYQKHAIKRFKVSQWLETYREYADYINWQVAKYPAMRPKLNPVQKLPLLVPVGRYRAVGPLAEPNQGSTHSRVTSESLKVTPELKRRAESTIKAIPADTPSPEQRATREWAQWVLETPERIQRGLEHSKAVAIARNQSHALAVAAAAANSKQSAISGNRRNPDAPVIPVLSRSQYASQRVLQSVLTASHLAFIAPYVNVEPIPAEPELVPRKQFVGPRRMPLVPPMARC